EYNAAKRKFTVLKNKYANLIERFHEITERKVSLVDEYGDEDWDELFNQIKVVLFKIMKQERASISDYDHESIEKSKELNDYSLEYHLPKEYFLLAKHLDRSFREHHKTHGIPLNNIDFNRMTGIEFESYLVKLLKDSGFTHVRGTPNSGDQGGDLLATKSNKKIIIQAKRHTGSVGNKAVQEVTGAVSYYSGDEGWVITNSTFTKSARNLAQKAKVKLIDGNSLKRISKLDV
ncbi:MAG: restriction endonuclease, partial [Bacteroidetes bacterium]|nr:restriction endonuclease [Bacteroidota bacterium]